MADDCRLGGLAHEGSHRCSLVCNWRTGVWSYSRLAGKFIGIQASLWDEPLEGWGPGLVHSEVDSSTVEAVLDSGGLGERTF